MDELTQRIAIDILTEIDSEIMRDFRNLTTYIEPTPIRYAALATTWSMEAEQDLHFMHGSVTTGIRVNCKGRVLI